jgi:hypothetical protein
MDVLCQAKSGHGKTAVFVLATLQQLDPQRTGSRSSYSATRANSPSRSAMSTSDSPSTCPMFALSSSMVELPFKRIKNSSSPPNAPISLSPPRAVLTRSLGTRVSTQRVSSTSYWMSATKCSNSSVSLRPSSILPTSTLGVSSLVQERLWSPRFVRTVASRLLQTNEHRRRRPVCYTPRSSIVFLRVFLFLGLPSTPSLHQHQNIPFT